MKRSLLLLIILFHCLAAEARQIQIDPSFEFNRLIKSQDIDQDKKITVQDKGSKVFELKNQSGESFKFEGTYQLSNLLQELKLLIDQKEKSLETEEVLKDPVTRISESIRERFWKGLTRRIDAENLAKVIIDPKVDADQAGFYLYIPESDEEALSYYQKAIKESKFKVNLVSLPRSPTPEYVKGLNGKHGLLSLALKKDQTGKLQGVPYVVPGGRFNEMYGWDSYFETLGLIQDGKIDLAQSMVDNFVYQINHFGKILNANRSYYLTRSQPPFLTSMIRAVYEKLPASKENQAWLKKSLLAALKEYDEVWMGKDRLTSTGLSRYYGFGLGIPPEVEKGHYDPILLPFAKKRKLTLSTYQELYQNGSIQEPELDEFFLHDRAVRESGHDTTYRWRVGGKDRCADFVTVDLNSLLLKTEIDLAYLVSRELKDDFPRKSLYFVNQAQKRKELMLKYLFDKKQNLFFDYNFKDQKLTTYISATTLYPLWAYDAAYPELSLLNEDQAKALARKSLSLLEAPGGLTATAKESLREKGKKLPERQWEYPNGWPPHQMIAWKGLQNFNQQKDAERLTYKWLLMITKNAADYNGTIPEKFDVMKRSHAVFAEYGNVGTKFDYITYEGFGWMNASYQVGLENLSEDSKKSLRELKEYDGK